MNFLLLLKTIESLQGLACETEIEGNVTTVRAHISKGSILCESKEFNYESADPTIVVRFSVLYDGFKRLDNSQNIHCEYYSIYTNTNIVQEVNASLNLDKLFESSSYISKQSQSISGQFSKYSSENKANIITHQVFFFWLTMFRLLTRTVFNKDFDENPSYASNWEDFDWETKSLQHFFLTESPFKSSYEKKHELKTVLIFVKKTYSIPVSKQPYKQNFHASIAFQKELSRSTL